MPKAHRSINKAQLGMYRGVWARVRKALVEMGDFNAADAEAERKAIQIEAIGSDKSSKDFTNSELNKVLDAFGKILVIFDGPSSGPSRNAANLIWAIEQLDLPDHTVAHIATDAYRTPDWRRLTERQLTCLRYTCTRHARSLKASSPANK
jgi:hypothetical protein